jgi:ribosomal-protein-alanine N-acetyltransferase
MNRIGSLTTDRLIALPLCTEDLPELCCLHQDPEVMKFVGGVRTEDETKDWLEINLQHWKSHGFGIYVFRSKTNGTLIGRCGLRYTQVNDSNEVELGYSLAAQYWRQGLATEMIHAILPIGFEHLRLASVIALIYARNASSRKLAERVGFRFEREALWKGSQAMLYRLEGRQYVNTSVLSN